MIKLNFQLNIEQCQKLAMTPELIQAIQILQFNNQELSKFVESQILENPILEMEKDTGLDPINLMDKIVDASNLMSTYKQWENVDEEDDMTYAQNIAKGSNLTDFLLEQLYLCDFTKREEEIGEFIINAIDSRGYLTMNATEIAAFLRVDRKTIKKVISEIKTFEPCGVGAENLKECLLIQLRAKDLLTKEINQIVSDYLEEIGNNNLTYISKQLNLKVEEVQKIADIIKSLQPHPGGAFSDSEGTKYILPDVYVELVDGRYTVMTNDQSLPNLCVSSYYEKLSKQAKEDKQLKDYLTSRFNSAMWLIKSISQRRETIYKISQTIVDSQQEFFACGEDHLKPLTLKEVAEEAGVHESTVSRTINGKYLQSSKGLFELKYFFSRGLSSSEGNVSSKTVKYKIKNIIREENPKKPLSDSHIVNILQADGVVISRRTVAKYREELNIPSSTKRRRF